MDEIREKKGGLSPEDIAWEDMATLHGAELVHEMKEDRSKEADQLRLEGTSRRQSWLGP